MNRKVFSAIERYSMLQPGDAVLLRVLAGRIHLLCLIFSAKIAAAFAFYFLSFT